MKRRLLLRISPENLAVALGLRPDIEILGVFMLPDLDEIAIKLTGPQLPEVCEGEVIPFATDEHVNLLH